MKKILFLTLTFIFCYFFNTKVLGSNFGNINKSEYLVNSKVINSEDSTSRKNYFFSYRDDLPGKKVQWIEDEGGVDCITYKFIGKKSNYSQNELVNLSIKLEYIDQLSPVWKKDNCTNLSIKVIFPDNFVQTGGTYYDYIPLIFSKNEKVKELTIQGYFSSNQPNPSCFLLLKGPEFSNAETIFIKKQALCFEILNFELKNSDLSSKSSKQTISKSNNLNELLNTKRKSIELEQRKTTNSNNPLTLFTKDPDLCLANQNCDSTTICIGESIVLYSAGCEDGLVLWSTGSTAKQISVSPIVSTTYIADCFLNQIKVSSDSAKVSISNFSAPIHPLTISGPDSICAGQSFVLIANGCPETSNYLFTFKNSFGIFQLEGDVINQTTDANSGGIYYASFKCIENGICGSVESSLKQINVIQTGLVDSVIVIGKKISALNLNSVLSNKFCIGENVPISVEGCSGQIKWPDNSTGNNYNFIFQVSSQTLNYLCEYQNCIKQGTLTFPAGISKLNTPFLVFDYNGQSNLKATKKTSANNIILKASQCDREYLWWDGIRTQNGVRNIVSASNNLTQIYSVKCADPTGLCVSDSASVGLYNISIISSKDSLCFGDTATLFMNGCINGIVRWYKEDETVFFGGGNPYELVNENSINFKIKFYGQCISSYTNTVVNFFLNSELDSLNLFSEISAPIISSNKSILIPNATATLTATGCSGQVIWSNGLIGQSISVSSAGLYNSKCKIFNCLSQTSNEISIVNCSNLIPPTITQNTPSLCNIVNVDLIATGCPSNSQFKWLDGINSYVTNINRFAIWPTDGTKYQVSCLKDGCESAKSLIFENFIQNYPKVQIENANMCEGESKSIAASNCNGTISWYRNDINGTILGSNVSNITINANFNSDPNSINPSTNGNTRRYYVQCNGLAGSCTFGRYFSLTAYSNPFPPIISPSSKTICKGQSTTLSASISAGYFTKWVYDQTEFTGSVLIISPLIDTYYSAKNYLTYNPACSSSPSNSILVKVSQGVPIKQTLTASSNTFCGSEDIVVKSTNCSGTLNWQWSNTNGQSGTLTADSIKTQLLYNTTYSAKCVNACGISSVWSDPITISKIILAAPTISSNNLIVNPENNAYLSAINCPGGIVKWSNGLIGSDIAVQVDSISTFTAICQIGTCLSGNSNEVTLSSCSFYKPTIVKVTDNISCAGGNKVIQIQVADFSNGVTWKLEDELGNLIYQISNPGSNFGTAYRYFNIPENSFISASIGYCSLFSDKIYIESNGVKRPNLELLNHPSTLNGNELITKICSIGKDSLVLKADGASNGQYVWTDFPSDTNINFDILGNNGYLYYDFGSYGYYNQPIANENDSLYTLNLAALGQDEGNSGSIFVLNYKDGCLSYPTEIFFEQRPKPIKPIILSNTTSNCPGGITNLFIDNPLFGATYKWYDNNDSLIAEGQNYLMLTVTPTSTSKYYAKQFSNISNCDSSPSDLFTVVIDSLPNVVNVQASRLVVCGDDSVLLKVPSCNGNVVWQQIGQNGILGSDSIWVSPTITTSYTAKCLICNNVVNADTVTISIGNPSPPVISTSTQLVCNTATGRVPIQFSATGCNGGIITWSDGTIGRTFEKLVNESIIYSATCKFGNCVSDNSNLKQITVLTPPLPPVISASSPIICASGENEVELFAEGCNGTLAWQGLSLNTERVIIYPTATTTYNVTCTNSCGSTNGSIQILVESKPNTPLLTSSNAVVCPDNMVIMKASNCIGSIFWLDNYSNSDSIVVYPYVTSIYQAICISESGTCISDTASITINVTEPPYLRIISSDSTVCIGETVTFTPNGCLSDISWSMLDPDFNIIPLGNNNQLNLQINYSTYIKLNCLQQNCLDLAETEIFINPVASPEQINIFTSRDSICIGENVSLTASICSSQLKWSTSDTTNIIIVSPVVTTTYTAFCISNCDTTIANVTVVVKSLNSVPNLAAFPSNICRGEKVRFTVSNCNGNLVWLQGQVSSDTLGYYASPLVNTNYAVICNNNGCLSDTSSILINVNTPVNPILKISSDSVVCKGSNVLLRISNCNGAISWSNGAVSLADSNGISSLILQINDINVFSASCKPIGCSIVKVSNAVVINYIAPPNRPNVVYSRTQVCKGEQFTAVASGCNGTIFWSNGTQGDSLKLTPTISNIYYAYCSNTCGISLSSDFTQVSMVTPKVINITSNKLFICPGDSATLSVNSCNGVVTWNTPNGSISDSIINVSPSLTYTYKAVCLSEGCSSNIASYTLMVRRNSLKPTIITNTGETAVCGGSSIVLTATGCQTGTLAWSNGQTNVNPITVTPTRNKGGYAVRCLDVCSNTVSDSIYIEVIKPTPPALSNDTLRLCYGQPFSLSVTSACDLGIVAWNDEILFGETLNLTADFIGKKVYRARCILGNCRSPLGNAATVFVAEKPTPTLTATSPVKEGSPLNISVAANGNRIDAFEWKGPSGFNPSTDLTNKNVRVNPATLAHSGQYTFIATNGGVCIDSVKIDITVLDANCGCTDCDALTTINPIISPEKDFGNLNYIALTTYLKPYQAIPLLAEGMQQVSYFDGMGRGTQQIGINAGGAEFNDPKKIDVISFMEYDEFSRETKKYLPFAKQNNGGNRVTGNLWNQQKSYYATQDEKAIDQNYALAETLLEESPLNRVLKQSSPGQNTQLSSNNVISVIYGTNNNDNITQPNGNKSLVAALLLNKVKQFDFMGHEAQIESQKVNYKLYAPNQLSAIVNINEDQQYSAQFTDKEGKVISSRQYNRVEIAANVFEDQILETNYIYDLFGRLRFVIQPEASKLINALSLNSQITPFTSSYKDFVFYYEYDKRGRMTRKRVPGMSSFVSMEYDERDLLLKSTDANGKITSTEYDILKRPIKNFLQNTAASTPILLTESYYDKYTGFTIPTNMTFSYVHASNTLNSIYDPIDLPTGTRTIVLNENNQARLVNGQPQYLTSIIYYDYKYRPLQTVTENIFGKIERTSNKLDFSGRILESHSTTEYLEAGVPKTLETYAKNTYDQASRLAAVCQKLDNDKWEPISRNSYSPMGELSIKKLGCDQQRVDFEYNIKGWLTNINKPNATASTFLAQKDLFAMKLNYTGNFTGNIIGQQWQTSDRTDKNAVAGTIQNYTYQYDELNRILKADFVGSNTNGISTTMYNPTQTNKRAYDLNGNILGLYRNVNNQAVDALTYNYTTGNRLNSVTDANVNTDTRYFTDLNKTGADYTYDAMGNMITDANKSLNGLVYNHQNLPTQIQRIGDAQAGKMKYYYTGTGQKLMVEIFDGTATIPNITKTRYYLGGLVMKGSKVEFINTPEGRAIPKASIWTNPNGTLVSPPGALSTWTYEYQLKDHLGNMRVACRCGDPKKNTNNGNIQANAAREPAKAIQTEDYDAWGLSFGSSTNIVNPLDTKYKYNGKELVEDLNIGLYEYGFRWYDAQIAKFVQVDPLADEYSYKSTYDYAENSPLSNIDLDGLEKVNVTFNFGLSLGTNGFKAYSSLSADLDYKKFGSSIGFGLTYHSNLYTTSKSGLELRSSVMSRIGTKDNNLSLGTNIWTGGGKLAEFNQQTGMISFNIKKLYFRYENDGAPFEIFGKNVLADLDDKYRSAAATLGWWLKDGNLVSLDMNVFTGRRDSESYKSENAEWSGHDGIPMGVGKYREKYTHGFVHEKGEKYRFGGLALNFNGISAGINSNRWVSHPFQNILAHDKFKPQRQFPVQWGGAKSNIQYSSFDRSKNKFTGW